VIMMIIITVVIGFLLGLATSARTPTDGLEDLTRNIVVAMAGAFVALQVARGMFKTAETGGASVVASTVAAISGAIILLFIVNRVRRA
jgi:uncharacterized membrane protein YeaQ/YmgE (transglycosylase-associated protein family)